MERNDRSGGWYGANGYEPPRRGKNEAQIPVWLFVLIGFAIAAFLTAVITFVIVRPFDREKRTEEPKGQTAEHSAPAKTDPPQTGVTFPSLCR